MSIKSSYLSFSVPLSAVLVAAGAITSLGATAQAGPDDSVWYQPPTRTVQPAQHSSHSHRSSNVRVSYGRDYSHGYHFDSRYRSGRSYDSCYSYSYPRSYRSSSYRYYTPYRSYSRPTVISYPSSSTRITYVTPVIQDTQYTRTEPAGAYDAVSYREYQRLLAEQRVLRQQLIEERNEQQRQTEAAPTYNPGPPVPSNAPLNLAKESPGSQVKADRPRSADEIVPPVPSERSVQAQSEAEAQSSMPPGWKALADRNFDLAMARFTELAGQEGASTADRVGFAVAATAIGQRERAAWAMRRVLIADPEGFGFIPASDELRMSLKRLASDIGRDAEARSEGPERRMLMFLAASIDYLALDMDSGLQRLDQAVVDGQDHHEGAVQLRRLLKESGATGF